MEDTVKKLYISGPMTGIRNLNRDEFCMVENVLLDRGYEVVNPAEPTGDPTVGELSWEEYLAHDINLIRDCDGVAVLDGWHRSSGAQQEVAFALQCEITVKHWRHW
jgi:nucleoside 2-deoxyribosyltransferase